jgi:hypothetical protein
MLRVEIASNKQNKCNGKSKLNLYSIDRRGIYIQHQERLRGQNFSVTQPRRTSAVVGECPVRDVVFTGGLPHVRRRRGCGDMTKREFKGSVEINR